MAPEIEKWDNIAGIRNVVILAHVDHGKTTITDSLLAHQGFISAFQAGQLRYLDSLPDEQRRGITMKSSSITITYQPISGRLYPADKTTYLKQAFFSHEAVGRLSLEDNEISVEEEILVHLIDTPGHVDFYGQVYASSLLADGAVIVIDVVEGICAQTLAAFRLAHEVGLLPVIFLNKIDRLIQELAMSSMEIYIHLSKLLESVNTACSPFRRKIDEKSSLTDTAATLGEDEDVFYFDPRKGNVVFGSAIDGWGFRLSIFANLFSKKIPSLSKQTLNETLWGPYYLSKGRQIKQITGDEVPLFVSLILENIVNVYRANEEKISKICAIFSLPPPTNVSKMNQRDVIKRVFKCWIPLSSSLLDAITDTLPNPSYRNSKVYDSNHESGSNMISAIVAKPIIYPELTEEILRTGIEEWKEKKSSSFEDIVMMCRLVKGKISLDSTLFFSSSTAIDVNGNKLEESYGFKLEGFSLFQLMASKLCPVKHVPEGHIFGISGIMKPNVFIKGGFLSSVPSMPSAFCPSLPQRSSISLPLISVACEPAESLRHLSTLQYAMLVMYQTDPSIGIGFSDRGELILEACGELHLEKTLNELQAILDFPITISDPIVPLGETISIQKGEKSKFLVSKNQTYFRDLNAIDYTLVDENEGTGLSILLTTECISAHISLHPFERIAPAFISWDLNDETHVDAKVKDVVQKAFDLAIAVGPLCGEKVYSLETKIHCITINQDKDEDISILITPLRKIFHMALLVSEPRLMQGYNEVSILVSSKLAVCLLLLGEWLGRVYALISKANGDVIQGSEYIPERNCFTVMAHVPVRSSASFVEELRSKTAGAAFPSIGYFGLKRIELTPLEIEDDDKDVDDNISVQLIRETRSRKGLFIGTHKIIVHGEKQRTLRRC